MSYVFYKLLHYLGLLMTFFGLGGLILMHYAQDAVPKQARRIALISHGLGLFLVLLAGFGMLARLGITTGLPTWIWVKLVLWALLGGSVVLARKMPQLAGLWWIMTIAFGFSAAYVALLKPF